MYLGKGKGLKEFQDFLLYALLFRQSIFVYD